jgi:dTDP-4-amino-4,6-dideoxygalactose transaminase
MRIPLVDLAWQHRAIDSELRRGFEAVFARTAFIAGEEVRAFEERFARFSGLAHCVGVASGTDALELALRALGVGPGDEVIVPAFTFVASALAAVRAGARPILVDVDERALLVDPEQVAGRLGARTRAVIPVHLYGQLAPMEAISAIARRAGVHVVEDAAQAHGARRNGRPAGGFGAAAAVSFYPGKNLGAYGDAGAVLCDDAELAARIRRLRNYGGEAKYEHPEAGFNSRLDTLQAVVLLAKLAHLAEWNEARRKAAARYDALLADVAGLVRPALLPGNEHVFHLYVVRIPDRDRVLARLHEAGIGAGVHYPIPLHRQGALAECGHGPGDFPVAERAAREVLSLPLFPGIEEAQQVEVAEALRRELGRA